MMVLIALFAHWKFATLSRNVPWLKTVLAQGSPFNNLPSFFSRKALELGAVS